MSYLIVAFLLCLYIGTFGLVLMFFRLILSLATQLIIKTCGLDDHDLSRVAIRNLLTKFIVQSFLLGCIIHGMFIYFLFDLSNIGSITNILITLSVLFVLNLYFAKLAFKSDWPDASKINLISFPVLVLIPPVLPVLYLVHYITSGSLFVEHLSKVT